MTSIMWSPDGAILAGVTSDPNDKYKTILNFYKVADDTRHLPDKPTARITSENGDLSVRHWIDNQKIMIREHYDDIIEHALWDVKSRQKEEVTFEGTDKEEALLIYYEIRDKDAQKSAIDIKNKDCSIKPEYGRNVRRIWLSQEDQKYLQISQRGLDRTAIQLIDSKILPIDLYIKSYGNRQAF